jgi:hypothetical protein
VKYLELGYSLPDVTAKQAASQAISVLEEIAKADKTCLFYSLQASNVLALAGLRAQSPYNEFPPFFSSQKQVLLAKLLHHRGYEVMYDDNPYDSDTRKTFSIMCTKAFSELPKQYAFISSFWKKPQKVGDFTDFAYWSYYFESSVVDLMDENKLPKDWLLDWWAPHNIRFGALLGYPGQAIASFCWDEVQHFKGNTTLKELTPSIPFQGIYFGAHVNFGYSSALKDDAVLRKHEALWSDVLTKVYEVFPESRTLKFPEFRAEYERYRKYNETH